MVPQEEKVRGDSSSTLTLVQNIVPIHQLEVQIFYWISENFKGFIWNILHINISKIKYVLSEYILEK